MTKTITKKLEVGVIKNCYIYMVLRKLAQNTLLVVFSR